MSIKPAKPIRVLIVDDHPMIREGVASILEPQADMVLAGEAGDGAEAVDAYRRLLPDITLMDLQMPEHDGVTAITTICREFPGARIIVLTTYRGDARALRALRAGAAGYLLKSTMRTELLETIRAVSVGGRYLPHSVANEIALHAIDDVLTCREIDILQLVAQGDPNKRIAFSLGVGEETVKSHLKSAFAKLQVSDRTHAVVVAARRGIIEI